jgi:hypothetical protein
MCVHSDLHRCRCVAESKFLRKKKIETMSHADSSSSSSSVAYSKSMIDVSENQVHVEEVAQSIEDIEAQDTEEENLDQICFERSKRMYFIYEQSEVIQEVAVKREEVYGHQASSQKTSFQVIANYFKYIYSSGLTMAYLTLIMWGIWTGEAVLPTVPVAHFIIFIFCLTLVFYLEGLQVAILAVEHNDPEQKKHSHPRAYELIKKVRIGNNVDKFLVGRQFFTIFVMTLAAQVTTFPDLSTLGIPEAVWFIFVRTGFPAALVITTIGSLQPQLLAAKDPWQFLNMYGTNSVMALCYGLEWTGICTHFAWLLIAICKATVFRTEVKTKAIEIPEEEKLFYYITEGLKYVVSTFIVMTYFVLLMWGQFTNQAVLPVPGVVAFILFALSGLFLAHLEGLQVAMLVAEGQDPAPFAATHPRGFKLMTVALHEKNVRRFLIGRQFLVIFVVFLINQCTIFPDISHLGINEGVWFFFVSLGFPTAMNILCLFQLPAQLLGNTDPYMFMDRYGPTATLNICLFVEWTGLAHFSWVVSAFSRATWFRIDQIGLQEVMQIKAEVNAKNGDKTGTKTATENGASSVANSM